jgi:trehalose 2-sulfotransferase
MKPRISYTIWFSQRTGSTLLTKALEATAMAGKPGEWFNCTPNLLNEFHLGDYAEIQKHLWKLGSTDNGVWGIKHSFYEPHFSQIIDEIRKFPGCFKETSRPALWEAAFPNHRHIFMSRRNKVRLAVSWWRAIQSQEWHLLPGQSHKEMDLSNGYSFDAINHLYNECSLREAGIQEFFAEGGIVPLNIYYEDFVQQYEETIRTVLRYLDLDDRSISVPEPSLAKTADEGSEEWVQRYRQERQAGWPNRGW